MQALFTIAALILIAVTIGAFLTIFPGLWNRPRTSKNLKRWLDALRTDEQGGYVHDTAMSQYIPPNIWNFVTGTFTSAAGQVVDTICIHRAAANETSVVTIPITIPSNSVAQKGAYLKSIEIDYEVLVAEPTSITPLVNKVTRGIDGAVAVVAAQTHTQSPVAATAKAVDQHKLVLTITTPFWVDNDEYVLVELTIVAGAGGNTMDFLGAVANFTLRI